MICTLAVERVAADPVTIAEDFGLFDHAGRFHQLSYYHKDPQTKAIVLFSHGIGCPLVRKRYRELEALQEQYESQGVRFWLLNASEQDLRSDLRAEAEEFDVRLPILKDGTQEVARSLGISRTGEAIVIETDDWRVLYRGKIDDRLSYEKEKPDAGEPYLKNALESLLEGNPITVSRTDAPGCKISFPTWNAREGETISYAEDIAPLIQRKCVGCHQKGGIGPFALSSFRKARGWADMIREVVMTRRMPPWQADPHHGSFDQDLSLSTKEQQILLHWIEQGTPRGEGEDLLTTYEPHGESWILGKPDLEIAVPDQAVPADGIVDYRYIRMDSPFAEDTWINGAEVRPGDRKALHHLIVYIVPKKESGDRYRRWLVGYAPGIVSKRFPADSGVLVRKDEPLLLELHYTSYGKESVDRTVVGLHQAERVPEHTLHTGLFIDEKIKIPPHHRNFEWSQSREVESDIVLHSLTPHMHFRGKSMRFELEMPDGTIETLLSVPYYNFNWQHTYTLSRPRKVSQGSKLILHAEWDNSERNPANPNPDRVVTWGEQSFDEMFFGTYQFVIDES